MRALFLSVLVVALAPISVASAATPPATTAPAPTAGTQQPASVTSHVASGIRVGSQTVVLTGQQVTVRGDLTPAVPGEIVTVDIFQGHRHLATMRVRPKAASGAWSVTFRPSRAGGYAVRARHLATAAQADAHARTAPFSAIDGYVRAGSSGATVKLLQHMLATLGYANSQSGSYDLATEDAVIAFRSANYLSRIPLADGSVFSRLFDGSGAFKLRYPRAGRHVEFDWTRQVVVLADNGRPQLIYRTSSGKPSTPTVFGTFRFYRKDAGTNSEGMFDSNYFISGYAIHGYPDVPTYPASHGCIRVQDYVAPTIFAWIKLGEQIFVYQ